MQQYMFSCFKVLTSGGEAWGEKEEYMMEMWKEQEQWWRSQMKSHNKKEMMKIYMYKLVLSALISLRWPKITRQCVSAVQPHAQGDPR